MFHDPSSRVSNFITVILSKLKEICKLCNWKCVHTCKTSSLQSMTLLLFQYAYLQELASDIFPLKGQEPPSLGTMKYSIDWLSCLFGALKQKELVIYRAEESRCIWLVSGCLNFKSVLAIKILK